MRHRCVHSLLVLVLSVLATVPAHPQASVALQNAVFGKAYKVQLSLQVSGFPPFTFAVTGGALPACLHLSPDGVLTGAPATACRGTYAFTVAVIDQKGDDACLPQRFVVHVTDGKTAVAEAPVPAPTPTPAQTQSAATPAPTAAAPPPAPVAPAPVATATLAPPPPATTVQPAPATPPAPATTAAAVTPAPAPPAETPAPATPAAPVSSHDQPSASAYSSIAIDKVTAGDLEVTASKATANAAYTLFDWPATTGTDQTASSDAQGTGKGSKPVQLAIATADQNGTLDFTSLAQAPAAGDTVRILTADDAKKLNDSGTDTAQMLTALNPPSRTVAAATPAVGPRVIVGYQQSGANSANSSGRLYVDVYFAHALRRALSSTNAPPPLSLFGDVRIGSTAQNSSSTIGDFVAGIAGTASTIKINQIASVAEFLTGLEYSPLRSSDPRRARLSFFGEYGATGRLQAAELNNTYAFPVNTSQAYTLLVAAEKSTQGPNPATSISTTCVVGSSPKIAGVADNCMFVEFAQQQPYFDQEAFVGLKSISYFPGSVFSSAAPAILSAGFGANHAVNRDMRFNAMRFEGMVPLAVPTVKGGAKPAAPIVYLFGNANLAIDHSRFPQVNSLNFISLNPASSVVANNATQQPGAGNTYVIPTQPSRQEYYSIGVGVDLVNVWDSLFSPSKKSGQ